VPVTLSRHKVSTDRARELFKPFENEESFLVSIKKLESFGFEPFCGQRHNKDSFKLFWLMSLSTESQSQEAILCFFLEKN